MITSQRVCFYFLFYFLFFFFGIFDSHWLDQKCPENQDSFVYPFFQGKSYVVSERLCMLIIIA